MRETASVRTNIMLTPTEHRSWSERARARGISLAEYIRRSVAAEERAPSEAELAELEALAAELAAASARMHAAVDEALAQLRRPAGPPPELSPPELSPPEASPTGASPQLPDAGLPLDPAALDFGGDPPAGLRPAHA